MMDDGKAYFNSDKKSSKYGQLNSGTGVEYLQTKEWELKPVRKGPVPEDANYQLPEGTQTFNHEIYSIDGEVYPAQDIKGKVIA